MESEKLSPIQTFFNGKSVFITGGSGFLGKTLIEKLLRSCPGVKAVYVLIRKKKGKSEKERVAEILEDVLYREVKERDPKCLEKIVAIPGDCSMPGMGISEDDQKLLKKNVNVVFHVAATLRFDENLKKAIVINVVATRELINICRSMDNLESVVYVSTAYSHCYAKNIPEDVSEWSPCYDRALTLAEKLTEEQIESETTSLLGKWPNTYTFTKAFAEALVKECQGQLPVCVFRPGIVTSTMTEPFPGWVGNILGPTGLVVGAGCGVVRAIHCNLDVEANIVPADLVINAMLASATETGRRFRHGEKELKVYNFVSSTDNPITYRDFQNYLQKYGLKIPPIKAVWYYCLILCKSESLTYVLCLVLHWLPAFLIDIAAVISGKKPGMVKLYQKVHKVIRAIGYFSTRRWVFETRNVHSLWEQTAEEDREKFNFDIKAVSWSSYFATYIEGIRKYILKEDLDNLVEARKKWNRLYWYHQTLKMIFSIVGLYTVWYIICKLAKPFV